jgi:hypothetical protein
MEMAAGLAHLDVSLHNNFIRRDLCLDQDMVAANFFNARNAMSKLCPLRPATSRVDYVACRFCQNMFDFDMLFEFDYLCMYISTRLHRLPTRAANNIYIQGVMQNSFIYYVKQSTKK